MPVGSEAQQQIGWQSYKMPEEVIQEAERFGNTTGAY